MTPHNSAKREEIAKTVIMPGDPLRAKYIAEKYLSNYTLVNSIRNIYAYTGEYNGKKVTVMASGMGNPSMGIYSYELYKFYDVDRIIRIGTAGGYGENIELKDIVLVEKSYSESSYAKCLNNNEKEFLSASERLNKEIMKKANEKDVNIHYGTVHCSDLFYKDSTYEKPEKYNCLCVEMESFALFANAEFLNKEAACLLTISDKVGYEEQLSPEERQKSLNQMIELALETV